MRPLRLTMEAFGPYRETEVVDFTDLGPNRVFLIHGDTGSGKTTILDAMVFALYGDTSGGERRAEQMRCDSAPADLATQVQFDFSLGAKVFRVRRRPAQKLIGARGKEVSKPTEVTLWDRTGCAQTEEGKVLTTKVLEANAIVTEQLSFSSDQFRQVVVLPQGRFRELLSAGSDKREQILQQLFKTARFEQLEKALAERAKVVSEQIKELKAQREAQLGLVDVTDDGGLLAFIEAATAELQASAGIVDAADAASKQARQALTEAEAADEAHRALQAARAELERLEAQEGDVEVLRRRVEAAARAEKVQPAAERLVEAKARLTAAVSAAAAADQALAEARRAEEEALDALTRENERTPQRQAAAEHLRHLEGLVGAMTGWTSAQGEFAQARNRVEAAHLAARAALEAQTEAEQRLELLEGQLAAARAAAAQVEGARLRYEAAKAHADRCARLLAARAAVGAAEEASARLAVTEQRAREATDEALSTLARLEEGWRAGRAVALAEALKPGSPCPVCGATDHPAPARPGETHVSDEDLAAARAAAEQARARYDQAREEVARAKNDLTAASTAEAAIRNEPGARPDLLPSEADAAVSTCLAELEQLSTQAALGDLEAQIEASLAALEATRTGAAEAAQVVAAEEKILAAAEARMNERAGLLPEELREAGALEKAIDEARHVKQALDEAFESARSRLDEAREKKIALASAAAGAAAARVEVDEHVAACLGSFTAALKKHGFASEDDWNGARLPENERAQLLAELEAYGNALQQAKGRLQQADLAVADRGEVTDIEALRAAAAAAAAAHAEAIAHQADVKSSLDRLLKVKQSLSDIDARSEGVRRKYETVGVLAEVANGNNPSRVSFQRWVLGVYLDEVLAGASRKLFTMSKGRYQLQRQRDGAGRGRGASGLDLEVFDEYSGASRPAVTLSGGESFLAALALALALAETVQERAAGTPLETIFVDEGFGGLDSDALELSIDALMELQVGGRLVGVISHVPELRQVIPARLEVHGGSGGSHTRFVVP